METRQPAVGVDTLVIGEASLDWVRLCADGDRREQWCADGDGMVVVKRCAGGFRALDQNQRKYIGRFETLSQGIAAAEKYMQAHDAELYAYVLETWPFQAQKQAA